MQRMRDRFDTVVASVNIVAHEEIICVRALSTYLEKFHQVIELTMDIATDLRIKRNSLALHENSSDADFIKYRNTYSYR